MEIQVIPVPFTSDKEEATNAWGFGVYKVTYQYHYLPKDSKGTEWVYVNDKRTGIVVNFGDTPLTLWKR